MESPEATSYTTTYNPTPTSNIYSYNSPSTGDTFGYLEIPIVVVCLFIILFLSVKAR